MPRIPTYHEGNLSYSADSCDPVRNAVEEGNIFLKAFARGQYPGSRIPQNVLPGLRTIGYWDVTTEQHWGLNWHRNEGVEISFLLNGQNVYETGSGRWELNAGDIMLCPPWQVHRIGGPNIGIGTLLWFIIDTRTRRQSHGPKWPSWIILSEKDKNDLIALLFRNPSRAFSLPEKHIATWKKLYRILRDVKEELPISRLAITVNEILYDVLEFHRETGANPGKTKNRSELMVQDFFKGLESVPGQLEHSWTLHEMASLCRISPFHFSRCCHRLMNLSPIHVLNRLRVRRAKELIESRPELSLTEIALSCGFSTSQYFATVFKKWTGKTPSEYKQETVVEDKK